MNEKVRKVFDILGVEPNEKFKLESDVINTIFYITGDLKLIGITEGVENVFDDCFGFLLINNIVKLPKEPKKKKLRDLTEEEYEKWLDNYCNNLNQSCRDCIFNNVNCETDYSGCWINNKDLYSDKFLDQEIEVEE